MFLHGYIPKSKPKKLTKAQKEQYEEWLANRMPSSLLVLQSNNYQINEHVRIASSLDEFIRQSKVDVLWSGQLELPLYTRYMIIGNKHV